MIYEVLHNSNSTTSLKNTVDYVLNSKNENDYENRTLIVSNENGIFNNDQEIVSVLKDNFINKVLNNREAKKQRSDAGLYSHIVCGFDAEDHENKTDEELRQLAIQGLRETTPDFDNTPFLCVLQNDSGTKHFHFVLPRLSNSGVFSDLKGNYLRYKEVAESLERQHNLVLTGENVPEELRQDQSYKARAKNGKTFEEIAKQIKLDSQRKFEKGDIDEEKHKANLERALKLEQKNTSKQKHWNKLKKQVKYAAKNAKNGDHFLKLLDANNIKMNLTEDKNGTVKGVSFALVDPKTDQNLAYSSGSKIDRKSLTAKALNERFNDLFDTVKGIHEQKQTTAKTVKNNAHTAKQTASTSNKSVKKPSKALSSTLPQKSNEIDKYADAETKKLQQYNQQKMADYDQREAKKRAEQNEQKDGIFKLFVDDYKELKEKENSRLSRADKELEKALIEESSFVSEEAEKPIKSEKKAIDLNSKKSVSWFSNLTKPSEEKYQKMLEKGFDLTTAKLPKSWNDKENAYKITNFLSDNKDLLSQKEKEHLFNNLKKNEASEEILSRAYKDFEPLDEAQKQERQRLLNKFKTSSNELASQYQAANRKPLHSSNKQVSTSVLKKKKDKNKKDKNKALKI
ncbi:relaxase/mobilization nuclease domain-containing protein [Vibrio parahaemolyticus]|uniref:relaxase/mobilization nuclease domain-containing protein n=1 Tax=Vibrio parahaemolyticus TaxID=670 RepID=UPI00402BE5B9